MKAGLKMRHHLIINHQAAFVDAFSHTVSSRRPFIASKGSKILRELFGLSWTCNFVFPTGPGPPMAGISCPRPLKRAIYACLTAWRRPRALYWPRLTLEKQAFGPSFPKPPTQSFKECRDLRSAGLQDFGFRDEAQVRTGPLGRRVAKPITRALLNSPCLVELRLYRELRTERGLETIRAGVVVNNPPSPPSPGSVKGARGLLHARRLLYSGQSGYFPFFFFFW